MQIKKQDILNVFENAEDQIEALIGLNKLVYPDFDEIKRVNGFIKIGEKADLFISESFVEFDKQKHPEVMAGGMWMCFGFSVDGSIDDWEIIPAPVEY